MVCHFPNCPTILSQYNKGVFCRYHFKLLYQNDVDYAKGKFVQWKWKDTSSFKNPKRFIDKKELSSLKETTVEV